MEKIEKQITTVLKEIEQMISDKEGKSKIESKRVKLDNLLKKYLENFK